MVSTRSPVPLGVFLEQLNLPSVVEPFDLDAPLEVVQIDPSRNWMTAIYNYLQHGIISKDDVEANHIARKAKSYTLIESTLYKQESHVVLMICISQTNGIKFLFDIHGGVYGAHHSY